MTSKIVHTAPYPSSLRTHPTRYVYLQRPDGKVRMLAYAERHLMVDEDGDESLLIVPSPSEDANESNWYDGPLVTKTVTVRVPEDWNPADHQAEEVTQ